MRRRSLFVPLALLSCVLFFGQAPSRAAGPRDSLVVSADWVAQHAQDANVVLLHVGSPATYAKEHIPGAQLISMLDVSAPMDRATMKPTDLTGEMPDPALMRETLQRFGISNASKIVVYYSDEYYSPSTRVIYALNWAGLGANTVLMQGGLPAWKSRGGTVTAEAPTIKPGSLSPIRAHTELIVDAKFVQTEAVKPGFALIDGRAQGAYDGLPQANNRPGQPPPPIGHIPGAHSVPFDEVFNERGELRSNDELEALFGRAGVKAGDTIVGYCWVGQQATATLFAARVLGHEVKLYDGSMQDWAGRNLPLEVIKKGAAFR